MRNNEDRLKEAIEQVEQYANKEENYPSLGAYVKPEQGRNNKVQPVQTGENDWQNQKAFQFSVPTEFVSLPSKGQYYPQEHPFCGKEEIEIYFMTAKEEDLLTSQALLKRGIVFDRLIQNLLVTKCDSRTLLDGDRNAVLIGARNSGFGSDYHLTTNCPKCFESMEIQADLEKDVVANDEVKTLEEARVRRIGDNAFLYKIENLNIEVEFRFTDGFDGNNLFKKAENQKKNKKEDSYFTDRLKQILTKVDGKSEHVSKFVEVVPLKYANEIVNVYNSICPNVKIKKHVECLKCEYDGIWEVPITKDFFWPNK